MFCSVVTQLRQRLSTGNTDPAYQRCVSPDFLAQLAPESVKAHGGRYPFAVNKSSSIEYCSTWLCKGLNYGREPGRHGGIKSVIRAKNSDVMTLDYGSDFEVRIAHFQARFLRR